MIVNYRRLRRTYQRPALFLLFIFFIDAVHLIYSRPDTHRITAGPEFRANNESIFIVSVHRNTEKIQRGGWNDAVVNLIDYLGHSNVHFSAVESGSQEDTKEALMDLKAELDARGVSNTISLGMTVWEQLDEIETRPPDHIREPGWIWNKREDQWEMRRIPYLANVRNQAMAPLGQLAREGRRFDKVLWLNDVIFDSNDIATLFDTNHGSYAAACSMDYKKAPLYYDTFALRDDMGLKTVSLYWPWFASPTSRAAALKNAPIKVDSCWNGIVVFNAEPYYAIPPLKFRGIDDTLADYHLEGSECCLIHADNYMSRDKGVWLNPNVRVGYSTKAYRKIRHNHYPGYLGTVWGAWANRIMRFRTGVQSSLEKRTIQKRLEDWKSSTPAGERTRYEPGEVCLINEMQIMWSNGWKHL